MKKPVAYPYMDYSTLEKRATFCAREIELNRRTAPDLYVGVETLAKTTEGFAWGGSGDIAEYFVVMHRFEKGATFDVLAAEGKLNASQMQAITQKIVQLHQTAAIDKTGLKGAEILANTVKGNDGMFRSYAEFLPREQTEALTTASLAMISAQQALLNNRAESGKIRQCHGDLHLQNICLYNKEPLLFDCIEFNDAFAVIDVLYDLAFLLMDLDKRGLPEYATLVRNSYLAQTGEYAALAVLPVMLATRAAIRSHVSIAIMQSIPDADTKAFFLNDAKAYLAQALSYLKPQTASLTAIGGLSGSGKSTLAAATAAENGAVVIRSDSIRKRLAGVSETTRLAPEGYTKEASVAVYKALYSDAETALRAGYAVIVDAVFAAEEERTAIEALAQQCHVPFTGIWLDTPLDVALERLATRTGDASDATASVRKAQETTVTGYITWTVQNSSPVKKSA
jgi:aminoglycoside phosphotransferase family enzyme/predicted kinase